MKFYYFDNNFPYKAVIYAESEAKAIEKYEEEVCEIDDMDNNQKVANLGEFPANDVAKDLQNMLMNKSEAILDDSDFQTGGLAGLFWSIVTSEWPITVWFEEP